MTAPEQPHDLDALEERANHHGALPIEDILALIARTRRAEADRERLGHLIDYAMHLHEHGECAPGHELSSWAGWANSVRAALAPEDAP